MNTQEKVQQNIAGIEYLLSRADTRTMPPRTVELGDVEQYPAFYICRSIMHDNLSVIRISLRVNCMTFLPGGDEKYTHRDIHGRGTTFEMALFDLSAQLISMLGYNEIIDTESLPIIEGDHNGERNEDTDKGLCANASDTAQCVVPPVERAVEKRMAARSDNSGRHGSTSGGNSRTGRKSVNGTGAGNRSQRAGR